MGFGHGSQEGDGGEREDGHDGRHVVVGVAVVLRSRRSVDFEDEFLKFVVLLGASAVEVDAKCKKGWETGEGKYKSDQRRKKQLKIEKAQRKNYNVFL